jgi:adenosylmethionine-8-amino-7-oxononanoate aminotransferase
MAEDRKIIYPLRDFNYCYHGPLFVQGENMWLYDDQGKRYLDGISGLWNVSFGHSNERINHAVEEQLSNLSYVNMISCSSLCTQRYAENLIRLFRGDFTRLIYTCSGSEAIESAVKTARKYHRLLGKEKRTKIAVLDMSYHGTTYAAMSASGMDTLEMKNYAPVVGGFVLLTTPYILEKASEEVMQQKKELCILELKELFNHADEVAAVLLEPVIGSGGIIPLPEWYLQTLAQYARQTDTLLIFDEVATGFGRTGALFAYHEMGVKPDLICLSKGINNGVIPMGATLLNSKVEKVYLDRHQYIEHYSTQNGNPLACAAANAVLQLLNEETLHHIIQMGNYLKNLLRDKFEPLDCVREIREKGLMLGIDLVDSKGKPLSLQQLSVLELRLRNRGLIVYPFSIDDVTGGLSLFPSYCIEKKEADRMIMLLYHELRENIIF